MFELVDVDDHVPIPAPTFPKSLSEVPGVVESPLLDRAGVAATRARFRQALLSAISAKYLFHVVPDVGLAVSVAAITQVNEDTHILAGQAKVWVQCSFTLVVFRPAVGDRLRARVVEQSQTLGLRLSVEFFDQIFVPPQLLVEGSEWEPSILQWGVRDEAGAFIRYTMPSALAAAAAATAAATAAAAAAARGSGVTADDGFDITKFGGVAAAAAGRTAATNDSSVICCVEQVRLAMRDSALAEGLGAAAMASDAPLDAAAVREPAMRIVASFSSCPGLGPESWFEENDAADAKQ